jgi:hypothetical protein
MGEGLVLSIPLEMSHLHRTWPGNRESHPTSFTKVPNAGFAAHNAAGDFLNGAVKNGKVKLPGTELCYTFEKNGKKFSAAWCITGMISGIIMQGITHYIDFFHQHCPR